MSKAVRRFGSALIRMGFQKGHVLGIITPNVPEFPIVMFGAAGNGMPVALVNPIYTPGETIYSLYNDKYLEINIIINNTIFTGYYYWIT